MRNTRCELTESRQFFHLRELLSNSILFSYVVRQFLNMLFGLIGLGRRRFYILQICPVGQENDGDNGQRDNKCIKADKLDQHRYHSGSTRAGEIGDRSPEIVSAPGLPD